MRSLRELLGPSPVTIADAEVRRHLGLAYFGEYLDQATSPLWPRALARFAETPPWSYWSRSTIEHALRLLEQEPTRTSQALARWSGAIGIGFGALFHRPPVADMEDRLDPAADIVQLATEFHPEYLRRAEHVFANLLRPYWAVLDRGTKFDLRGGVAAMRAAGHAKLTNGYDERVRNAIAHGEVEFGGVGIQYGDPAADHFLSSDEFLGAFDDLWETCNALGIAIILFAARRATSGTAPSLPASTLALLVAHGAERDDLQVGGVIETLTPSGRQLNAALASPVCHAEALIIDAARIAALFLEHGVAGYDRFLFAITHDRPPQSIVVVLPAKLAELLAAEAPASRVLDAIDMPPMIWRTYPRVLWSARTFVRIARANMRLALHHPPESGGDRDPRFRWSSRYKIKAVKNASAGGIARVEVTAVLRRARDADDRRILREVLDSIVSRTSWSPVWTNPSGLGNGWNVPIPAESIVVHLLRRDGTLRSLRRGWLAGNLVAIAQKVRGRAKPIQIKVDEVWRGLLIRWGMDPALSASLGGTSAERG